MKKENMRNENIVGIFVILILASIFVMPVSAQSSSIPIKLDLTVESSTISVGEKATITVRLLDENDKPVVTEIDVPVNLSTNLGYVPSSVIIHAKTNLSETEFRSGDPGIAVISAKSEGLIGDTTSIAVTSFPLLHIDSPSDGETVDTDTITVSGSAMGTEGAVVKSVTVNGVLVAGTTSWSKAIPLQPGPNKITVVATDDMGQSSLETITVYYQALTTSPSQPPRDHEAPSATPTPTPKLTVSISITTIPSGAKVWLDDFFKGTTPIRENVTEGYHEIKVIKEGYHDHSETKKIRLGDGEPEEMIIELKPLTASIYISSTPSGASVYLDNVDMKAITPCMLKVVVGQHTIKLTKSDYFDAIRNVPVSADGLLSLHETLTRCSYIDISSVPPGAEVYLDGNYKGETPKNISKVVVGNHTLKLTKFGYDDVIRNVSVSVGEILTLHENLTGYGSLSISSNPSGARVYLDGDYMGETPLLISKVVVGTHSIKLTKSDYADEEKMIHVSAGKTTAVGVSLAIPTWASVLIEVGAMGVILAIIGIIFKYVVIPVISPKLKEKDLLFSLDPSYRQHLKEGDVDEKLKNVFEENEQPLSTEVNVSKIAEKQWKIVDGEMQYSIEDTEKRLNVYKKRSN